MHNTDFPKAQFRRLLLSAFIVAASLFLPVPSQAQQQYIITTLAGGGLPPTPMPATSELLDSTDSVVVDAAGNVYFSAYNCIFRVDVGSGILTRVAGGAGLLGYGGDGGLANSAVLNYPLIRAIDSAGNLYIADIGNSVIRKVSPSGIISTVAGNGSAGFSGDGNLATSAQLSAPYDVRVDSGGNLYIADSGNHRIRKVAPNGIISTIAGNGTAGYSGDGGQATSAQINNPTGVALDATGILYISDYYNQRIRKIALNGTISTVAGNGTAGFSGDGGQATSAQIYWPVGVAVDNTGSLYIADLRNYRVRKVAATGIITTVAGSGNGGSLGGTPATNINISPQAVATDSSGNLYIADYQQIRKVTPDSNITTVAGRSGFFQDSGDGGPAAFAQLADPGIVGAAVGLAVDAAGNLFVTSLSRIRKVGTDGTIATVAGNNEMRYSGDGGPAINATFASTEAIAFDGAGNLYVAERGRVRRMTPDGTITTVVGNGTPGYSGDAGVATAAQISSPEGIAFDAAGNLYIADSLNNRIRKVNTAGTITTLAGTGTGGYSGDGGPAVNASLNYPNGLAIDATGNLYIADTLNCRVRKVAANGVISTIGGNCYGDYMSDGILAVNADFGYFRGVAVDATGVYISDRYARVRKIKTDGTITTIAGGGMPGYAGDGGPAIAGRFYQPGAIALGASGKIYVADTYPNVVRQLTPTGDRAVLSISKTHSSNVTAGQTGVAHSVVVSNSFGAGPTTGAVTVREIVPAGLTFLNMSGIGWICPSTTCTRSDVLNPGASYPAITAIFNVTPDAPSQAVNQVTVSGGGSAATGAADATDIPGILNPVLISPSNAATGIISRPVLSWSAAAGATSYDVYFGASSAPLFASNTSAATYTPATLAPNTTYFWRIVAKNGLRSAGSATWSFTTYLSQVQISGKVPTPGVVLTLSGSQSVTTTSDNFGNYYFAGLPVGGNYTVTPSLSGYSFIPPSRTFTSVSTNQTADFGMQQAGIGSALKFVAVPPCRFADTRNANGPFGGPAISGGTTRDFVIPNSACGIPSTAAAYSINVTVVPHGQLGVLTVFPSGQPLPLASTLNSLDGRVKANAAIVPAGPNGGISVFAGDTTDAILDIHGYFVPASGGSTLTFFPLTPCRVADTRSSNGSLGGPFLAGGQSRSFAVRSSSCSVPAAAQAYSMNYTVVPHGKLGYITTYPTGGPVPLVSTLNAIGGQVTANAAIVLAGVNGDVSVFAADDTDLVMDINGYFASSGAGGLSLYNLTPCRVLDTRNPSNSPPFSGTRGVNVTGSLCAVPGVAQAYVFSATVVPSAQLGYLSLWPQGQSQPLVSTLNAVDGAVTSNMAIVPTANGSINSFGADQTHLILDINAYFAP